MAREHGLSVPVSPLEHGRQPRGSDRPANDLPRTLARRSLSPPPMRDADPIDDSRRSRGRVRPLSMRDSYVPHDSSTSKNGDRDVLHINDTPSRISDPPRYPATRPFPDDERADHVPRHPRAMMETPGGGAPRGPAAAERSPRPDRTLPRQSVPNANLPSLSARDRQWVDRPTPVEPNFSKRESTRLVGEVRAPPTAPNVRLSGTNSTPIGNRGRLAASVALPPAPSNVTHRGPIMSGSNAEPVGSRTGHTTKEYEHPPRPDIVDVPPSDPSIRDDMRVRSPASARRTLPPPEAVLPSRPSRLSGTSSIRSDAYFAEEASRATPPPLSRESSAVSIRDAVGISRHSGQLTRRPNSPPANRESLHHMSMQRRVGDEDTRRTHHDRVYSAVNRPRPLPALSRSANYHNNMEVDAPRQWQNTPHLSSAPRRHTMETYVPERSQDDFQDPRGDQFVTQPEPMVQDIVRPETRTPSVHPDRARMLQNGLPPRPPTDLGRSRSGRGQRREKNENENRDVTFGPGDRRFEPSLPAGGQRHPEADVRPQPPANRGGSLLDRLTMEGDGPSKPSSLRDRVQLPSKRDREEMQSSDLAMEQDVEDQDGIKRARRRGAKARKGRR
ncbi:hypothetical protein F5I97DRAFT_347171 [Phlebopus sp. FC_14]|nr:hypothetical protein F5I97DRAFT_347171 [Phlebopus sp. FC_14]